MFYEVERALSLGAKHGLKALPMFLDASVEAPKIDEKAISGPVAIVVTLGAVIICLYIAAIVVGSMSKTALALGLPANWTVTVNSLDVQANSSFGLAGVLPIAIIGVGILTIIIGAFAMQ
jgi:hypothetical protein